MQDARIDFETRSSADIKEDGGYLYAEDAHFLPLIATYKIGDGARKRWAWPDPCPEDLAAHTRAGGTVWAFNAGFERRCFKWLHKHAAWPLPRLEQFKCSQATARALALPGSLENLAPALSMDIAKDAEGKRLISKFSIPRWRPDGTPVFNEIADHPDDAEKFKLYCDKDVEVEEAALARMMPLPQKEWDVYWLNERINDRGVPMDVPTIQAAIDLADRSAATADRQMAILTGGAVERCSQPQRLREWVVSRGVPLENTQKAELEDALTREDLPSDVEQALELRLVAAKASVSKLRGFLRRCSADGRLRGAFVYHAAGTGRFSSTGAQLHNLPRPRKLFSKSKLDADTACRAIRTREPAMLSLLYGDDLGKPLHFIADCIRHFIKAPRGSEIMVADYSGIEGAVAAWFCQEEWKLDALRLLQSPAGKGQPDLYMRAAASIYNVPAETVTDELRQVGKVAELSLQYQGAVGAFQSMARNYGLKLADAYPTVWEAAGDERRAQAEKAYKFSVDTKQPSAAKMSREAWLMADLVKRGWRAGHPGIVESWSLLEEACKAAVANPGTKHTALGAAFLVKFGWLWLLLPSGRTLAYGAPRMKDVEVPWSDKTVPKDKREKKAAVTVLGSEGGKLLRYPLYGGLLLENVIQGLARDLLCDGMKRVEAAGYPVIAHIHDEVLCEVPKGFGDNREFAKLLTQLEPWASGLPLAVGDVHRMTRYRKA